MLEAIITIIIITTIINDDNDIPAYNQFKLLFLCPYTFMCLKFCCLNCCSLTLKTRGVPYVPSKGSNSANEIALLCKLQKSNSNVSAAFRGFSDQNTII